MAVLRALEFGGLGVHTGFWGLGFGFRGLGFRVKRFRV